VTDKGVSVNGIVAVTGAEGFIGSHLVEALVERGDRVRAMVQYNSFSSYGWLETLAPSYLEHIDIVMGDVRDRDSVLRLMKGADVVYHLAALIAIPYSYEAPASYVETNVLGTLNVLEAARTLGTSRVVHTSTSEVYGTARTVPISEEHPLQAQSPYSASKIAADKVAESYFLSFGLPVVTLRPFNTYGPRQSARAVISTVIAQVAAGKRVIKLGSLAPTRDFNFVLDTAAAFVAVGNAAAETVVGEVFNAGSGSEISIGDLVHLIGEVVGVDVAVVEDDQRLRPDASEVKRLVCDSSRLQSVTSWKPAHHLEEGLRLTTKWFADPENRRGYKPDIYNV
jgi:NDP-hexose 4,6-dehydratase